MKACTYLDITYGYPFIYDVKDPRTQKHQGSTPFILLYFKVLVAIRESRLAYDLTSLWAEIGGYTGLLLGISMADFAKMFKLLVHGFLRRRNNLDPPRVVID